MSMREHAAKVRYGATSEPVGFLVVKNAVFAAVIVGLTYPLSTYKGLPNVFIIMFALMMIFDFVTNRTTVGRRIYALGGNEKAARLSGIKTDRLSFYTFITMGVLAAPAGLGLRRPCGDAESRCRLRTRRDRRLSHRRRVGDRWRQEGVTGAVIGAFIGA